MAWRDNDRAGVNGPLRRGRLDALPCTRAMTTALPSAGRLFIASMPPMGLAAELAEHARLLARTHGGRPVPAERIHLTLRFLGTFDPLDPSWVAHVAEALAGIDASGCALELTRFGSFPHGRQHIGWIGPVAPCARLGALVAQLDQRLADLPWIDRDRRPFRPHVTLLRDATRPLVGPTRMRNWPIEELVLMHSRLDRPEYRPLARVYLTGPSSAR